MAGEHNMKACSVALERLSFRVAIRECRVLLRRLADEDEDGDGAELAAARTRRTPAPRRRVLRSARRAAAPASITVRKEIEMGRLRSSTRYPLRQKLYSQTTVMTSAAMQVTRRSCWRRGRTRSKKPPPGTEAAAEALAETERAGEPGGDGEPPAAADPPSPSRRLQCFRITIQAMVRGGGGAVVAGFGALFADYEKAVLKRWLELSDGAAATYLSLLGVRGPLVRGSSLEATCPGARNHFATLAAAGFVSTDIGHSELSDVLALLRADEMEQIAVSLGLEIQRRTKLAMARALTRLHASGPQEANLLQDRVRGVLGGYARVLAVPRELVERALLAVAAWLPVPRDGDRLRAARTLLLKDCARLLVPEGHAGLGPSQSMFTTRQQLLEWVAVATERVALGKAIATGKMTEVLTISAWALAFFRKQLESATTSQASLAIGGALAELMSAASEPLSREPDVEAAAVSLLRLLLGQRQYCQERRATWAVRLAALLQTRQANYRGAADLLVHELEDEGHSGAHRCRLEERARTLLRAAARNAGSVSAEARPRLLALEALLPAKEEHPEEEFRTVKVWASACAGSLPGMKRVYVSKPRGQQASYVSVEERAMLHFTGEYPRGVDDEGETLLSLAVLALWGAVYDGEVQDAWGTPLQDRPLDWGRDGFWVARHLAMEQRLQAMQRSARDAADSEAASRILAADLREAMEAHRGKPCLVRWDLLRSLDIEGLLKCLTVPVFVAICRRFFLDFCSNRQGFPDLLLWNPDSGKSLFVEVKGPGDTLSPHQVKWLEFLRSHGADVAVAVVQVRLS